MKNEKEKRCKTKGCNNPVLDGKYCEYCKQKQKEVKDKALFVAGGVALPVIGIAIKKGVLKKVPEIAKAVLRLALRR
jgi:hypothetical protein